MHCMRSAKQEYVTAMNGLEALEQYQATPDVFKAIFMGELWTIPYAR